MKEKKKGGIKNSSGTTPHPVLWTGLVFFLYESFHLKGVHSSPSHSLSDLVDPTSVLLPFGPHLEPPNLPDGSDGFFLRWVGRVRLRSFPCVIHIGHSIGHLCCTDLTVGRVPCVFSDWPLKGTRGRFTRDCLISGTGFHGKLVAGLHQESLDILTGVWTRHPSFQGLGS